MIVEEQMTLVKCENGFNNSYYLLHYDARDLQIPIPDIDALSKAVLRHIYCEVYGYSFGKVKRLDFYPVIKTLLDSEETIRFVNDPNDETGKQILVRKSKLSKKEMDLFWKALIRNHDAFYLYKTSQEANICEPSIGPSKSLVN